MLAVRSLIYLVAAVLADGSIDTERYTVTFTEDKRVVEKITKTASKIGDLQLEWKLEKQKNSMRARTYSKKLCDSMLGLIPSFRTRPLGKHPTKIPIEQRNMYLEYPKIKLPGMVKTGANKIDFLRVFATCDGGPEFSVYSRKNGALQLHVGVKIGCDNPYLRKEIKDMMSDIRVNFVERNDGIIIKQNSEIIKFAKTVGFLSESTIRKGKLLKGFTKNDALTLMLMCAELSKQSQWINKNFSDKKRLESFLVECIELISSKHFDDLQNVIEKELKIKLILNPVEFSSVTSE